VGRAAPGRSKYVIGPHRVDKARVFCAADGNDLHGHKNKKQAKDILERISGLVFGQSIPPRGGPYWALLPTCRASAGLRAAFSYKAPTPASCHGRCRPSKYTFLVPEPKLVYDGQCAPGRCPLPYSPRNRGPSAVNTVATTPPLKSTRAGRTEPGRARGFPR